MDHVACPGRSAVLVVQLVRQPDRLVFGINDAVGVACYDDGRTADYIVPSQRRRPGTMIAPSWDMARICFGRGMRALGKTSRKRSGTRRGANILRNVPGSVICVSGGETV